MPITNVTYKLIQEIKNAGIFPPAPHMLEIGESNWYGDVPFEQLAQDINRIVPAENARTFLTGEFERCVSRLREAGLSNAASFDLSRVFYKAFLDYESYTAIDLSGSSTALKLDLNKPVSLDRRYDVTISFGTAEHVFNVYQFFRTLHEVTGPGGVIIISSPFQGWVDHGFYNFQPTFYYDLAAANGYDFLLLLYAKANANGWLQIHNREHVSELAEQGAFSGNGTLFSTFRKPVDEKPFSTPMQGYYNHTVSRAVADAWQNNR